MELTPFHQLMDLRRSGDQFQTFITDDWLQGRTTFGGLTAALCLKVAQDSYPDLPPVRSAQIAFIGPAAGEVTLSARILRKGCNVTFVQADLMTEKGLATTGVFCFGATRESAQRRDKLLMPVVPPPENLESLFPGGLGPSFAINHLDHRVAKGSRPFSGEGDAENYVWTRFKNDAVDPNAVSVLALGDGLPPAEMSSFKTLAPISTMTWLINFLTDTPSTQDGWWLLHANAEHSVNGYSSQNMTGWNFDGEAIFAARQLIAIFA